MIWSHYILLYFWYCLEVNHGQMLIPLSVDSLIEHLGSFGNLIATKGVPSQTMWICYFTFFFVQILLASFMPGEVDLSYIVIKLLIKVIFFDILS